MRRTRRGAGKAADRRLGGIKMCAEITVGQQHVMHRQAREGQAAAGIRSLKSPKQREHAVKAHTGARI